MTAQVTRADATQLHRYLPLAIDDEVRGWMQRAFLAGTASDMRFAWSAPSPISRSHDGKGGQFQVQAKAQGVTLDYAAGWPVAATWTPTSAWMARA